MYFSVSLGEAYQNLKQFHRAEIHYNAFLTMAEKVPPEYIYTEFPYSFARISNFYRIIGKTKRARELLAHVKDNTIDAVIGKTWYYENLFRIDSTEKRYLDAIKDLQLSIVYQDTAFSNEQRKNADELLVKYEAEKKDKNIELLNSQNQLQRIQAEQATKTKNITLGGLALLLIIIGLLFNQYLIKQRSNRELEINQRELEANQRELDQKNSHLETLNAEQNKLLKEKEWLIKEVHHRVKNNLQMVTSLLHSQSAYLKDDAAVQAVRDSLRRMQAMALIHQKLYQDENTSTIFMPEYIHELVRYLHESFKTGNRIVFKQMIEPLELDVTQAIPLGLIINESIVNAIKYAFLNEQEGIVRIRLQRDGATHLLLDISDNGIGLPAELDLRELNSLGLELIQGLARQLNGSFTIENNHGVHILIRFRASLDPLL
ncbi:sensor histidine kinase [Larkinella terrae]|uniref:sensor histidine kinase n=1 Tax=Larkinella terrae TaxID=2025311 RepID=UPI001E544314|nr:sensor histidine kinase [Larkinella terrae]